MLCSGPVSSTVSAASTPARSASGPIDAAQDDAVRQIARGRRVVPEVVAMSQVPRGTASGGVMGWARSATRTAIPDRAAASAQANASGSVMVEMSTGRPTGADRVSRAISPYVQVRPRHVTAGA